MQITPLQAAWKILQEAETTDFVISLSAQNIPPPRTVEAHLRWLEAEAERQLALAELHPDETPGHHARAARFREFVDRLRDLGFAPLEAPPPNAFHITKPMQTPPVFASGPMKQAAFAFFRSLT